MNIQATLSDAFKNALATLGVDADPVIKPASKPQFGDYQVNGIIAAAKTLNTNPRQLAQAVLDEVTHSEVLAGVVDNLQIAGPGFINITLHNDYLTKLGQIASTDNRLGIAHSQQDIIVVDYSSPNVAKEMHVGHLRGTIIGDSVVRTLEFLGNTVIRANHIGDWGTQFGMLIAYLEKFEAENGENASQLALADIENFYRKAKALYDSDPAFAELSRHYVVLLQNGDKAMFSKWQQLVELTMTQAQALYDRLGVSLSPKDTMGESLYNPMLKNIAQSLIDQGIAVEDDGAFVVYMDEFKTKTGDPLGVIIQKNDGGFLYTTTDIAAAQYRKYTLNADKVMIFTDARQSGHMKQAWSIAKMGGFVPEDFNMVHHTFGMMMGKDGKPFKTRTGDTIKLTDLLDEAQERATVLINERQTDLNDQEKQAVIDAVAIGAVKYADLSKNRNTDYIFDWDSMLNFEGNTAPYMQYAYTRIRSIFAKAAVDSEHLTGEIVITDEHERRLLIKLLQFEECLVATAKDALPNILALYLYELAGVFSAFYEHCPILSAQITTKNSRLLLAKLTANTLKTGLNLLGIKTVEKM